jgi:hypothetical protein
MHIADETLPVTHARPRYELALEVLVLALAPVAAWLLFGIVLIKQEGDVDPWFYVGYGRIFPVLQEVFGWPYYAVRFPVVMVNHAFMSMEPAVGNALLRYALFLTCGVPLYVWARHAFGRLPALVAYLFLACNPLLGRIILWNYTSSMSVPLAVAGMAVWLRSDRAGMRVLSGFLLLGAAASHAFTVTAVGTFLAAQAAARLRRREWRAFFGRDVVLTAVGALTCFAVGYLYYAARIGFFDPRIIYQAQVAVVSLGHEYAGSHMTPFNTWGAHHFHIYVPMACVAIAGLQLGRRLFDTSAPTAVWWFSLAYCCVYLVYQFVLGGFVLETFYYFGHLTTVVFLLVPIIVHEFASGLPARASRIAAAAAIAVLIAFPLYHRIDPQSWNQLADRAYGQWSTVAAAAAAVLVIGVLSRRVRPVRAVAGLAMFLALVQTLTMISPTQLSILTTGTAAREEGVYRAAIQLLDVFGRHARARSQMMLWYCSRDIPLQSIASSVLLFTVQEPWNPTDASCAGEIGKYEIDRLNGYPVKYVMMLDEEGRSFAARDASLRKHGYTTREVLMQRIGDDAYTARMRVVEIAKAERVN